MKNIPFRSLLLPTLLAFVFFSHPSVQGIDYLVDSDSAFEDACDLVGPGDSIIWKNGTYDDQDSLYFEPLVNGTAASPITMRAETPGGVAFRGNTRLLIGGRHLIVSGFRFDNSAYDWADDESPGSVIQSRAHSDLDRHAYNCRVTDCAIINYDNPAETGSSKWVQWYGESNRFDHCFVSGKRTRGATFIVELNPSSHGSHAFHLIDHNVFADRPPDPEGRNEFETIRTGTSDLSDQNAHITVVSNYFYRCSGEAEIISNKSCENTYRYNTFVECAGSLVMRHGRGCTVEGNVFLANNIPDSGGIRLSNQDHVVLNNYLQDIAGTTYQAALAIMNGTTWNPPSNPDLGGGYVVVKDCVIAHNTIVNAAESVHYGVGDGSSGRNTPARDNTLAANILSSTSGPLFTVTDAPLNTTYHSNLVWGATVGVSDPDLIEADPMLTADALGIQRPSAAGPAADLAGTEGLLPGDLLDLDGALRPLTGRDIGCDEIALGALPPAPMCITNVGPAWIQSSAPPSVTADPQALSNAVGTTLSLSVGAIGAVPLFYQWRRDGVNLVEGGDVSGSDEATVLIANAELGDAGDYDVIVGNGFGSVTSAVGVVSVYEPTFPPSITSHPAGLTVLTGDNATFTVEATGTEPLGYQWYFDTTTLLTGETNSTLTLVGVDAADEGSYHAVVSNPYGLPDTSDAATLTVIPPDQPAEITVDPVDDTVTEGQTAEFSVTAVGTPPLSYQWYFNTNTVLSGETGRTLSIPGAQTNDAGDYSVMVTNQYGSDTSVFALLTVDPAGPAGSYNYDNSPGTPGIQDGGADWTSTGLNWLLNGAAPNVLWDDNGPNDAVFGGGTSGSAGYVDVPAGATRTVRNITFVQPNDGEYTIDADDNLTSVLNLSGTPTITVADWATDEGYHAHLKIIVSGTGFTKEGPGTLQFGGGTGSHNTYSGLVIVNDGTLIIRKGSDGIEAITAGGLRINTGGTVVMPKKRQINDAATVTVAGGTLRMVSSGGDTFASLVLEDGLVVNDDTGTNRELEMTDSIIVQHGTIDGNAVKNIRIKGSGGLTKTTGGTVTLGPGFAGQYHGLTKVTDGTLILNGTIEDSYRVDVNDGATLGGAGEVENAVSVESGGTLSPGMGAIGTFTVGDELTLAVGSLAVVDVNASSLDSDRVTGFSDATYAGDLQVVHLSGTLAAGQAFQVFDAGGSGSFSNITPAPGSGLAWAFDAVSGILSVVSSVDPTPPKLDAAISNGNVYASWPASHVGWELQYQTNALAEDLWTWPAWPGSILTNEVAVPIDPAHTNLFLRLSLP